jgi:hypothetical protein
LRRAVSNAEKRFTIDRVSVNAETRMADINDELLTPTGMASARAALVGAYRWYLHQSASKNFCSIRATGLEPRRDAAPPETVINRLGSGAGAILCFHPIGSQCAPVGTPTPPLIRLAVDREHLPRRIGLDWSFSCYPWKLAILLRQESPSREIKDIFLEAVHRSGSVLSYDRIPVSHLRICCKSDSNASLCKWPQLDQVTAVDIAEFQDAYQPRPK